TNKASGGSYSASQSEPDNQPTYQIGVLNGKNAIRFDGTNDFLKINHNVALNILANQNFEIFSVVQTNNPAEPVVNNYPVFFGKGNTNANDFIFYVAINKFRIYMDVNKLGVVAPNNHSTAPNFGWARRQGATAYLYNTIGGYEERANVAHATMLGNSHHVTIGAAEDGNLRFHDGDIGEIILFTRALTNEERQQMEGYLAHKWGFAADLSDRHPYKNEAPLVGGNGNSEAQLIV